MRSSNIIFTELVSAVKKQKGSSREVTVTKAEWIYSRKKFNWIAEQLGIQTQEGWYSISGKEVKRFGGEHLLQNKYNGSIYTALQTVYPEYQWDPNQFHSPPKQLHKVPYNYWKNKTNQKNTFDNIANQLGIECQPDWYSINSEDIKHFGGESILATQYRHSLYHALRSIYPQYDWNPLEFQNVSKVGEVYNHWKDHINRRNRFDSIAQQLEIETQSDWYSVTVDLVKSLGASGLLVKYYNGSLYTALQSIYPEFQWNPFQFSTTPRCVLSEKRRLQHRQLLTSIGLQLGVEVQKDWYRVRVNDVANLGAKNFLKDHYNGSLFNALQVAFPEYEWNVLMCSNAPHYFRDMINTDQIDHYMGEVMKGMDLKLDKVTEDTKLIYQRALFRLFRGVNGRTSKLLQRVFPNLSWKLRMSGGESMLEKMLKSLSPHTTLQNQTLLNGHSVDLYLPQMALAFEFQGEQHYKQIHLGSHNTQKERDVKKKESLKQLGVTLVEVPHWWSGSLTNLLSTIQRHRVKESQRSFLL